MVTDHFLSDNVALAKAMADGAAVPVKGFAMPYNKANSYNEVIRPGAFTDFLKRLNGRPLPMGFQHLGPCGYWTKIEDRPEGLYCEGFITEKVAKKAFAQGFVPELSISFEQASDPDGFKRYSRKRIEAFGRTPPRSRPVLIDDVTEADLAEISLVDIGAFRGTWVKSA